MKIRSLPELISWLVGGMAIAAIYFGTAKLSGVVALSSNISPIWLPSPLAWAAMLLLGFRYCWGIWLGDVLFNLLGAEITPNLLAAVTWGATGSTIEAVGGAFLIQHFIGKHYPFDRSKDVFKFLLIACLCTAMNAVSGLTGFSLAGLSPWADFGSVWLTFWIGNAIGVVVFVPVLLTWRHCLRQGLRLRFWQTVEALLLLSALLIIGEIAFDTGQPVEYLLVPCLVWAAFRFGQLGAMTGILISSVIALWGTAKGTGAFNDVDSLNDSLLLLQTFMGSIAVTTLVLGSVLEERKRSEADLAKANEGLETKVEERTAALTQANQQLTIEIVERTQVEEALRQSQTEKIRLITSLQDQTATLEQALQDLQSTQAQLIQTEKMSSLGQLVAGVAHEINNPVNFIHGNLAYAHEYAQDLLSLISLYQQGYTDADAEVQERIAAIDLNFLMEDLPKLLTSMQVGADRIRKIVLTLRNFSRLDEADMKPVDVHEGIESTLLILQNRLKTEAGHPGIQIIKQYGELPEVECYASQLNQVFMNIINNAIDTLQERNQQHSLAELNQTPSTIVISTQALNRDWVRISIKDNGRGMTPAVQEKLFNPFFTTKPVGQGTGLGLSISHQIIVDKHGGYLKCQSQPGQGTEFWIQIPVNQLQKSAPPSPSCAP